MKIFKLVKVKKGSLVSIRAYGSAQVTYKRDTWSKAPKWLQDKGYHLLAFNSLEIALAIQKKFEPQSQLWECSWVGSIIILPEKLGQYGLSIKNIKPCGSWPKGTIMVRSLKLLKKVKV